MTKRALVTLRSLLLITISITPLISQALPAEFQKERIFSVSQQVSAVKFSPNDERIFVAEKSGIIRVYNNSLDPSPTLVVDLGAEVYTAVDHGLLGLAIHPDFPATPEIFAFYSHSYGANGARLKRITLDPRTNLAVNQQLLYEGWCNQSTTHGPGDLHFFTRLDQAAKPIHTLYMTVGEMASPGKVDLGQSDNCGDSAVNIGALRAQLFRTSNNSQSNYGGTLIRLSEAEFMSNRQLGKLTVAAYGLRNPFRFSVHPGSGEIYIADVGWNNVEEINYVPAPDNDELVENFGWPCYEGSAAQGGYATANTPACRSLYAAGSDTKPFWEYWHSGGQASATGVAVYSGNLYPARYKNGLFFADYSQSWIRFLPATDNGKPNRNTSFGDAAFDTGAPVIQLESGPLGDIYYLSYSLAFNKFELWHIKSAVDPTTIASASADATFVAPNTEVTINAAASFVASGSARYEWDLSGDGAIDLSENSGVQKVQFARAGEYAVSVRVSDKSAPGNSDSVSMPIVVTNIVPRPEIIRPEPGLTWSTGDVVDLKGGVKPGSAPAASFTWNVLISHCAKNNPDDCHLHDDIFRNTPTSTFVAPDHEYPAHLIAKLCATGFPSQIDGWWNAAWQSRRQISVDTSALATQRLFKVLLKLTPGDIDYAAAGSQGQSLRFVSKNGTVFSHRIKSWNPEGISTVWLQFPEVTGGHIANRVWMYYDNSSAVDRQDLSVVFPAIAQHTDRVNISAAHTRQQILKACETVVLQPRLANIILTSNPMGLTTTFGSTSAVWSSPIPSIVGSTATLNAPLSQVKDSQQFDFLNWSQGGGRLQEYITPDVASVTLTANYKNSGVVLTPCIFPTMNLRGTFNAWLSLPMKLVAPCTWGASMDIVGPANAYIKFDVANNWLANFGDTNNDGVLEVGGGNIVISGGAGRYDVTLNDQTKVYTVVKVAAVSSSSAASSVISNPPPPPPPSPGPVTAASIFHLRGTHNAWLEGDLFSQVAGSDVQFEICRNFTAGDAKGGPRFKVDPNGGWGDAFPAADVPVSGWTKILINGSNGTLISATSDLASECSSPTPPFNPPSPTNPPDADSLVAVNFTCHNGVTTMGQDVYVVGNLAQLGNWTPTAALKLAPTAYPSWTAKVMLPAGTTMTWKCIKKQGTAVSWQLGGDNRLVIPNVDAEARASF